MHKMIVNTPNEVPKFTDLNLLASESNGGKIVFATDDWFAVAENLLKDEEPVWKEGVFTDCGKWMDGWETRRKRCIGHDWTVIALGRPSIVKGFCLDTAMFTGNYAPRFSIQAAWLSERDAKKFPKRESKIGTGASKKDLEQMSLLRTEDWKTLIPMTELKPGYSETRRSYFEISSNDTWTHLRLNIFPDGGIARLSAYGYIAPNWDSINQDELIDLLAIENGGVCDGYSNAHYGNPRNLIKSGSAINMGDGWETARRLDRPPILEADDLGILQVPGNEWAIFRLGHVGTADHIQVDTNHFKGNFPDSVKIEGALVQPGQDPSRCEWNNVLLPRKLSPHKQHDYTSDDLIWCGPMNYIKVTIAPDGGISRLRFWGYLYNR